MSNASKSQSILWPQLFGLMGMQGVITLTWVIYNLYLPKLLTQVGLEESSVKGVVGLLLTLESLLAVFIEPLMGDRADRLKRWLGMQFPILMLGVVLASVLFLAIPAVTLIGLDPASTRTLLVVVMVLWAIAMAIFRSPLISLLIRYAYSADLPYAASFIVLSSEGIRTVATLCYPLWLHFGPTLTFGLGSFALLGAIAYLRWVDPYGQVDLSVSQPFGSLTRGKALRDATIADLALIGGVGLGLGLGSVQMRILLNPSKSLDLGVDLWIFTIIYLCTLVPFGKVASAWGTMRSLILGLAGSAICLLLFKFGGNPILEVVCVMGLGGMFSLATSTMVPFALRLGSPAQAGLNTGMLFGGMALAATLLGAINAKVGALPPAQAAWAGAGGLGFAMICVSIARQRLPKRFMEG